MTLLRRLCWIPLLAVLLTGCENSGTAYMIDGKDHALILVREQRWFWSDKIDQAVVASRLPDCQRRVAIWPGNASGPPMDIYEAGYRLWALHQGTRWYLASTDKCLVQDWKDPPASPPGPQVGTFLMRDGTMTFAPADTPGR
ncbi:hypothetical protein G3580_04830 [Nitrogeniibacter mangrovi]|uniref:Lipoprotein n=1 Tax=Nitrogeniibacter mangrovi TaxID=2016596 RepID=A0A6C1B2A8_9RHOO|nr:hypothetical protein [Nitrogeniibacter mangrovi]QID17025.1 hypothetical protein G3580_04830 [Nitrogeniibacter mangrovi]